jgi:hypothetical protein
MRVVGGAVEHRVSARHTHDLNYKTELPIANIAYDIHAGQHIRMRVGNALHFGMFRGGAWTQPATTSGSRTGPGDRVHRREP